MKERNLTIEDELTEFLLYTTPDGQVKVEIFFHNENIWLTQKRMAELFNVNVPAVSKHLNNIYESRELVKEATISLLETVQIEGKRTVNRKIEYYNLDAIISVGYRVNSRQATMFRIWATNILKEFMIKGFILDDERLKNGRYFGKDYFEELLERVRSIRASERRIYQKITDIFAECSIDYDPKSDITKRFFASVQNKFHFAISGHTAAEIIYENSNADTPFMGLKTWKSAPKGRILKTDSKIAKNYLDEKSIKKLEKTISAYFDYIENVIENRISFDMEEFAESINRFLEFNEYEILHDAGNISHEQAKEKAYFEYEKFNKSQKIESDFDKEITEKKKPIN
jgi:hypothetical protein